MYFLAEKLRKPKDFCFKTLCESHPRIVIESKNFFSKKQMAIKIK